MTINSEKAKKEKGTTLVEILFYFVILGIVLFAAMNFTIEVLNISHQSDNLHEIQTNINFISQKIVKTVQNADSIDMPGSIFDNDNGYLSLNVPLIPKSPTAFYVSNGDIYIKEGSTATKINSDAVECTLLRFRLITYPKAPDQVIIDATFKPKNTELANFEQNLSFHTSVSLRK